MLDWPSPATRRAAIAVLHDLNTATGFIEEAEERGDTDEMLVKAFASYLRDSVKPKRGVNWRFLSLFIIACAKAHRRIFQKIEEMQIVNGAAAHTHPTAIDYNFNANQFQATCLDEESATPICAACCTHLHSAPSVVTREAPIPIVPLIMIVTCKACARRNTTTVASA